jgi:hypothetical protein
MFMKDRHTGAGREGSGRVSVYRATGITYCYTLECNFNTGRITNGIPMASRDLGRASPPPTYDCPPKYGPPIYEDAGKSLAVSILDLTESNPWTRLTCSSCKNLKGVRAWVGNYLKTSEAEAAASKAAKSAKASPMRTRLRSITGIKKSVVKQLKLPKSSPSSPDAGRPPPSKMPRKIVPPKNSQSASSAGKLMRQFSNASLKGYAETPSSSVKRLDRAARIGSGKVKKMKRPGSSSKGSSRGGSKPGSRASSPRRSKTLEGGVAATGMSVKALAAVQVKGGSGKKSRRKGADTAGLLPSIDTPLKLVKKKKRVPLAK